MCDDSYCMKRLKRLFFEKAYELGVSHLPSGLSALEILYVIYNKVANITIENASSIKRDRVIISKEHCRWAQLCTLVDAGLLEETLLNTFKKDGGKLGHDMYNIVGVPDIAAVDYASGSLGHGLSVGAGYAWDGKHQIFVICGDGEMQEGSCWEALLFIAHHKLCNITVIIDCNSLQIDNYTKQIIDTTSLSPKAIQSLGFCVVEVNGHDVDELFMAFAKKSDMPKCIIAHTIKGKELEFVRERDGCARFHWMAMTEEDWSQVKRRVIDE